MMTTFNGSEKKIYCRAELKQRKGEWHEATRLVLSAKLIGGLNGCNKSRN